MRASHYAKAFVSAYNDKKIDVDVLVTNLFATARANDHESMLPRIVRQIERTLAKSDAESAITVTTATELDAGKVQELLKQEPFKRLLTSEHRQVIREVDPSIIGGAVVRTDTTLIDGSYKHTLIELYRSLIRS